MLPLKPTGMTYPDDPKLMPTQALDYENYLVLSLGTGTSKTQKKYKAKMAARWGLVDWLYSEGFSPMVDAFTYASVDMVNLHMSLIFRTMNHQRNYLRIQVGFIRALFVFDKYSVI